MSAAETLRLLSYNIRHGAGMDLEIDLERIAGLINRVDPDLVLFQEVDNRCNRSGHVDQMATFAERTDLYPLFGPFWPYDDGEYGLGALARWPLLDLPLTGWDEPESRFYLAFRLDTSGWIGEITFADVHFYLDPELRLRQANGILAMLSAETGPVIIAGDYNSKPGSEVMSLFGPPGTIVEKSGLPFTFPADEPDREIDLFYCRPADRYKVIDHRVVDERMASDHRPLLLEIAPAWPPTPPSARPPSDRPPAARRR